MNLRSRTLLHVAALARTVHAQARQAASSRWPSPHLLDLEPVVFFICGRHADAILFRPACPHEAAHVDTTPPPRQRGFPYRAAGVKSHHLGPKRHRRPAPLRTALASKVAAPGRSDRILFGPASNSTVSTVGALHRLAAFRHTSSAGAVNPNVSSLPGLILQLETRGFCPTPGPPPTT